jgi:hypothetical protein
MRVRKRGECSKRCCQMTWQIGISLQKRHNRGMWREDRNRRSREKRDWSNRRGRERGRSSDG